VAVSYVDTPEESSYTSCGTLTENTSYNRNRLEIGGRHYGLGLKFVKTGAGDFHGFDISAEVGYQEESKRMHEQYARWREGRDRPTGQPEGS